MPQTTKTPNFTDPSEWLGQQTASQPPRKRPLDRLTTFAEDRGLTITSTTSGRHNPGSKHPKGEAIDVRTKDQSPEALNAAMEQAAALGYRVRDERQRPPGQRVWGGPHLHLEYTPEVEQFDKFGDPGEWLTKQESSKRFNDPAQWLQQQAKSDTSGVMDLRDGESGLKELNQGRVTPTGEFILKAPDVNASDGTGDGKRVAEDETAIGAATYGKLVEQGQAPRLSTQALANPGVRDFALSIPGLADRTPTDQELAAVLRRTLQAPDDYNLRSMEKLTPEYLQTLQQAGHLRFEPEAGQWQWNVRIPEEVIARIENVKAGKPAEATDDLSWQQLGNLFAGELAQEAPDLVAGLEGGGAALAKTASNVGKLATLENPQTAPENSLDEFAQKLSTDAAGVRQLDPSVLGQLKRGLLTGAVTMPMINELALAGGMPAVLAHGVVSRAHLSQEEQLKGLIVDLGTMAAMNAAGTLPGAVQAGIGGSMQALGGVTTGQVKTGEDALAEFLQGVAMSPAAKQKRNETLTTLGNAHPVPVEVTPAVEVAPPVEQGNPSPLTAAMPPQHSPESQQIPRAPNVQTVVTPEAPAPVSTAEQKSVNSLIPLEADKATPAGYEVARTFVQGKLRRVAYDPAMVTSDQAKQFLRTGEVPAAAETNPITPRTVTHPDPALNGKPVLAETKDGRVIVPNPDNKTGVSVVKDRTGNKPAQEEASQAATDNRPLTTDHLSPETNQTIAREPGTFAVGDLVAHPSIANGQPVKIVGQQRQNLVLELPDGTRKTVHAQSLVGKRLAVVESSPVVETASPSETTRREPQTITDARQRLQSRLKSGELKSGFDPAHLRDLALTTGYDLYYGAADFAAWSKDLVTRYGAQIKPYLQEAYGTIKREAQKFWRDERGMVNADFSKLPEPESKPAAQPVRSFDQEKYFRSVEKMIDRYGLAEGAEAKANQLLEEVTAAYERKDDRGLRSAQRELALHLRMATTKQTDLATALSALGKANLLSGVKTHLRNLTGNTAYQVFDEVSRIPASLIDAAVSSVTKQRSISNFSLASAARSSREAATKGVAEAWETLKTGISNEDIGRLQLHGEINLGNSVPSRLLETYINGNFRLLAAEDKVFRTYAYNRSLEDRAKVQALNDRLQGHLKGQSVAERTKEYIQSPTDDMIAGAIHDAEVATFNNDNKLSTGIAKARAEFNAGVNAGIDLVMPFDRTPTNVLIRTLEATPLGVAMGARAAYRGTIENLGQAANATRQAEGKAIQEPDAYEAGVAELRQQRRKDGFIKATKEMMRHHFTAEEQRAFMQAFGRASTGSALLALGYMLAKKGLATSMNDKEEGAERERNKLAGRQAGAIRLGDGWHQISSFAPVGSLIAIGAQMYEEGATEGLVKGIAHSIKQQPLLEGATEVVEGLRSEKKFDNTAGAIAGRIVPTIASDVGQAMDAKRKASGFTEQIQKRVPIWREGLPEDKDVFGGKLENRPSWMVDPTLTTTAKEDTNRVIAELLKQRIALGKVQQKEGESAAQYEQRLQKQGEMFYTRAERMMQSAEYRAMSDTEKKDALETILQDARGDVTRKLIPPPKKSSSTPLQRRF